MKIFVPFFLAFTFTFCTVGEIEAQKINGVSIVSSESKTSPMDCSELKQLGANWVAITPFALMQVGKTEVIFDAQENWYGHREVGLINQIRSSKNLGLKVCIKPHLYVKGQGWPGEYNPGKQYWPDWESNYRKYILFLANIAQQEGVDLLLIGTECKTSVNRRPEFWNALIDTVQEIYSGKLSYAANWDNYREVPFWNKLDFVSIDAYFPLCNKKTPTSMEIELAWKALKKELNEFAQSVKKQIIFTEYGYRSTDNCAWQQWVIESRPKNEKVNTVAQSNAYQGFYNSLWDEEWLAGGFIWKWYPNSETGGNFDSDYTPQNKPVLSVIKQVYKK